MAGTEQGKVSPISEKSKKRPKAAQTKPEEDLAQDTVSAGRVKAGRCTARETHGGKGFLGREGSSPVQTTKKGTVAATVRSQLSLVG